MCLSPIPSKTALKLEQINFLKYKPTRTWRIREEIPEKNHRILEAAQWIDEW